MRFNLPKAKETPKNYEILPWTEKYRTKYPIEAVKEYLKTENIGLDRMVNHLNFKCGVDRNKCELIKNCLENEIPMVYNNQEVNLVINIPFCLWRCFNCTNVMYDKTKNEDVYPYFFEALLKEIIKTRELIDKKYLIVKNIVFTGNLLSLEEDKIENLFRLLNYTFCDITVEVGSPDFITEQKLLILKKYNVRRVVFNVLSFNTQTLRHLCRRFEFKELYEAYKFVVGFGFETSFELVVGLLDENQLKLERNLKLACELGASNINLYSGHCKYIEETTKNKQEIIRIRKLWDFANSYMLKNGYKPYFLFCSEIEDGCFENVGYSIPKQENKYFIDKVYDTSTTIGCGTNVESVRIKNKNEKIRLKNTHNISQYIFGIDEIIQKKFDLFS